MGSVRRERLPGVRQLEKELKRCQYCNENSDFEDFWRKYRRSGGRHAFRPVLFPWSRQVGFAAVAFAAVVLVAVAINIVFRAGTLSRQISWKLSGPGVQISGPDGGRWNTLDRNSRIALGSRLKTDKSSEAVLTVHGAIKLKLYGSSEIRIRKMGMDLSAVDLPAGSLAYISGKLLPGQSVQITTPLLNVVVTGTRFLVSVDRDKNVKVSVVEGNVRIVPLAELLTDGQTDGAGIRRLADEVVRKSGIPVSKTIELKARDQEEFYRRSRELIRQYSGAISRGDTAGCADQITALFHNVSEQRALTTATADSVRSELSSIIDKKTDTVRQVFRTVSKTRMTVTGRESEILELPGGRQCYTVDNAIVFLSVSGGIEMSRTFGNSGERVTLTRPQLADGLIIIGSDADALYALNLAGSSAWTKEDAGTLMLNAFPLSCGKMIVVPTMNHGLRFFDRTGTLIPTLLDGRNEGWFYSPLVLMGGRAVLFGNEKGDFTVFNVEENRILWSRNIIGEVSVYALTGGDRITIIQARKSGATVAIRPGDGSVVWKTVIGGSAKTRVNPVVDGNRIAISADDSLFITDLSSGRAVSSIRFPARIVSMKWFRGQVLVGDDAGVLHLYDVASGTVQDVYRAQSKTPVIRISVNGDTISFFAGDSLVRLVAGNQET